MESEASFKEILVCPLINKAISFMREMFKVVATMEADASLKK
jgi:hypothetical protein